ncbi:MAG: RNA polymerase sigma factor [Bacteroidota bacterium]
MNQHLNIHQELIEQCKRGERRAQAEIFRLYSQAMFNVSLRILNRRDEAEDVLQESFVKMFQNLDKYQGKSSFGAWFKRIVVNHSINQLKKRRLKYVEMQEEQIGLFEEVEEIKEYPVTVEQVKQALKSLPDGFRVVFTLYMFEDYSHKEIANELGISVSTSKSQLNRAKNKIRNFLMEHSNERRQA